VPAILTWRPGQRDAAAINADGADGSLVAGTFVAFVPPSKPDDRVAFQEDGFSAVLGPPSTGRLVDVLTSGGSCAVESNGYVLEVSLSEP
jgi:hypothetical protein